MVSKTPLSNEENPEGNSHYAQGIGFQIKFLCLNSEQREISSQDVKEPIRKMSKGWSLYTCIHLPEGIQRITALGVLFSANQGI